MNNDCLSKIAREINQFRGEPCIYGKVNSYTKNLNIQDCYIDENWLNIMSPLSYSLDSIFKTIALQESGLIIHLQYHHGYLGFIEQSLYLTSETDSTIELHLSPDLSQPSLTKTTCINKDNLKHLYQDFIEKNQNHIYLEKICSYESQAYSYNKYTILSINNQKISNYFEVVFPSGGTARLKDKTNISTMLNRCNEYIDLNSFFLTSFFKP